MSEPNDVGDQTTVAARVCELPTGDPLEDPPKTPQDDDRWWGTASGRY